MENRKSKRSVRLALVLGAAVAGTALVGFGGLAAWQAYTQNSGNTFSVGTLSHTNVVTGNGVTCGSTTDSSKAAATPCKVIVTGDIDTSSWGGAHNSVVITNDTTSMPSTFSLSSPASDPPQGGLCAYLSLQVSGIDSPIGSPYVSQSLIGSINSTQLNTSGGNSTWNAGDSNTFTFTVSAGTGFADPANTDKVLGQTCTFDVLFTQAA